MRYEFVTSLYFTFLQVRYIKILISKLRTLLFQAVMARRVQKYLDDLLVILDEDKLREMSNACEPAQGSGE